jgi:ankyrin repeat protein
MSEGYLAQVQALIDQQMKENPEEMKRKMEEFEENKKKKELEKIESTKELVEELNKGSNLDISKVKSLIIIRGADISVKSDTYATLLHQAVWFNDTDLTQIYISKIKDVNIKNMGGYTPLEWACIRGSIECVELLLEAGADPNCKDYGGMSLYKKTKNEKIKELLQKYMK